MFLAEAACLLLLFIDKSKDKRKYMLRKDFASMSGKVPPKFYHYILPSLFDFLSAGCYYTALNFINGSTFQFIRCGSIITTGIFSYCLTRIKFKKNQYIGSGIAFTALLLTAFTEYFQHREEDHQEQRQLAIGLAVMFFAVILEGLFYSSEQWLFHRFHIEPLKLVGLEGLCGFFMALVALLIMSTIRVDRVFVEQHSVCIDGKMYYEGGLTAMKEIFGSWLLLLYCLVTIVCLCIFNSLGIYVTKLINAQGRCLMQATRAFLIWLVGVIITSSGRWDIESTKWQIILLKLLSLSLLLFGVMLYTELICVKRQEQRKLLEDEDGNEHSLMISTG